MSVTVKNIEIGGGIPKIAVPIIGKTESEILHQADRRFLRRPCGMACGSL